MKLNGLGSKIRSTKLSRKFYAKTSRWPSIRSPDSYDLLWCLSFSSRNHMTWRHFWNGSIRKESGTEFPVLWSGLYPSQKNIWLGCCAPGSFMTAWRQPGVPFICIWPVPLSCALRNSAFGLRVRVISRHTYIPLVTLWKKHLVIKGNTPCQNDYLRKSKEPN